MGTLKDEAQSYEAPQTLNVAELEKVPIDLELKDGEGKDGDGEVFKYKFIVVDGVNYRIPGTVIGQIKVLLGVQTELKFVKVLKSGEGLKTRYQVIPFTST